MYRVWRRFGSSEMTAALIALSALVALAGIFLHVRTSDWLMAPGALLIVNLIAALSTNARLKSLPMLFALHAALVVLILLIGLDRLTSMSGRVEVAEGAMFDASAVTAETGALHRLRLDAVKFEQGAFAINYAPGMKRRETESYVRLLEENGRWRDVRIGDDTPLIVDGYRFYTTHNKGFAPVLTYVGPSGSVQTGAVHLPSYPANDNKQGVTWTPPGGTKQLKVWLHIPEPVFEAKKAWTFSKPANARVVLIDGDHRHELGVGDTVALDAGQIRYDGLHTWMGYTIVGQALTSWVAAAAVMACVALLGHVLSVLLKGFKKPVLGAAHGT